MLPMLYNYNNVSNSNPSNIILMHAWEVHHCLQKDGMMFLSPKQERYNYKAIVFLIVDQERLLDQAYLESDVVPRIATEWYDIGLYLEMPDHDLDCIKQLTDPCGRKCIEMLSRWLKRDPNHPNITYRPTWKNMYNAMIAIDFVTPAEELKKDLTKILNGI